MAIICMGQTPNELAMEASAYRQVATEILKAVVTAPKGGTIRREDVSGAARNSVRMSVTEGLSYEEEARLVGFGLAAVDRFFDEVWQS